MRNRITLFSVSVLAFSAVSVHGQTPAPAAVAGNLSAARQCDTASPVTVLGFTFAARLSRGITGTTNGSSIVPRTTIPSTVSYADEPLVGHVDADGPAANRIRTGDLIARVNGYAITTPEGAAALSSARPGSSLVLTVRRGENLVPVTIIPSGIRCPLMLGGVYAATPSVRGSQKVTVGSGAVAATNIGSLAPMNAVTLAQSGTLMRSAVYGGWLGLGFDCNDCGQRVQGNGRVWYFREPPVIYNVDTGSPAYNAGIRRGDVLLRVDGKEITSSAAGAKLGQVKPGQNLKLTYRRAGHTTEATVRVAQSPALRASTVAALEADQMLKSTIALRSAATNEARLRDLLAQTTVAKARQEATLRELETALQATGGANTSNARAALSKLRVAQDVEATNQQRAIRELLRSEQTGTQKLNLLEQQMKRASDATRPEVIEVSGDSLASYMRMPMSRDQKLRYSGSVGGADVEVRGPGSVNVQGDGDDLLIITADAVIRIKSRKAR